MPSSMLTYRYRVKDATNGKHLQLMAWAVNTVWNYCQEVSLLALQREKRWLTAFDLIALCAGASQDLGISSETIAEVCREYITRRRQCRVRRLKWRSRKRSLGWIPLKMRFLTIKGDSIRYQKRRFRFWNSRPIEGTPKTGSFSQDAQGRWYLNVQCEVADPGGPIGDTEIGIDLGCTDQIACSDGVIYSRENLTRRHEGRLALAQRAHKKRLVTAIHAKIANARRDWTHKVTTAIANRASFLAIGDVSSTKLAQTKLAKSVYDAAWGITRACLRYKAMRLGVPVTEPHEFRSSLTCAVCLAETGPRGLSGLGVREWSCSNCGTTHQRDHNSALNHLRLGRQALHRNPPT